MPTKSDSFQDIFTFDPRVRFCAVLDERGRIVESEMRKDLRSLEPDGETTRLFMQIGLAVMMDRGWDKFFGSTKFITIVKERVSILVFALADLRAVVVTTDPEFPLESVGRLGELVDVCVSMD